MLDLNLIRESSQYVIDVSEKHPDLPMHFFLGKFNWPGLVIRLIDMIEELRNGK